MSILVILLSLGSIISVWLVEPPVKDTAVSLLVLVERSAGNMRQVNDRVDQTMGDLQTVTTDIADAANQISQNVSDKGLVLALLPEEKEQALLERIDSAQERFNEIRDSVLQVIEVYRSVNRLPFVSLPGLSEEQMAKIETALVQSKDKTSMLAMEVADFRAEVSGNIDKVRSAADLLTDEITQVRTELAQLDFELATLETMAVRLQRLIPTVLLTSAVIVSLVFAFVIYTQVEIIRLFVARWRLLSAVVPEEPLQESEIDSEGV